MIHRSAGSLLLKLHKLANKTLDFLYQPFKGFLPVDSFRYIICGGANTGFEAILYFIFYNFIFQRQVIEFVFLTVSPHIAAFLIVFPIVFFSGFLLSRYLVFKRSILKGKVQLTRFAITILTSLIMQYFFMKIFVDWLNFYPTPSKILTSAVVAIFTFLAHRYFSFSTKKVFLINSIEFWSFSLIKRKK